MAGSAAAESARLGAFMAQSARNGMPLKGRRFGDDIDMGEREAVAGVCGGGGGGSGGGIIGGGVSNASSARAKVVIPRPSYSSPSADDVDAGSAVYAPPALAPTTATGRAAEQAQKIAQAANSSSTWARRAQDLLLRSGQKSASNAAAAVSHIVTSNKQGIPRIIPGNSASSAPVSMPASHAAALSSLESLDVPAQVHAAKLKQPLPQAMSAAGEAARRRQYESRATTVTAPDSRLPEFAAALMQKKQSLTAQTNSAALFDDSPPATSVAASAAFRRREPQRAPAVVDLVDDDDAAAAASAAAAALSRDEAFARSLAEDTSKRSRGGSASASAAPVGSETPAPTSGRRPRSRAQPPALTDKESAQLLFVYPEQSTLRAFLGLPPLYATTEAAAAEEAAAEAAPAEASATDGAVAAESSLAVALAHVQTPAVANAAATASSLPTEASEVTGTVGLSDPAQPTRASAGGSAVPAAAAVTAASGEGGGDTMSAAPAGAVRRVRARAVRFTAGDRACLLEGAFLNDSCIDWWNELIYLRGTSTPEQRRRLHFFSAFFYRQMSDTNGRPDEKQNTSEFAASPRRAPVLATKPYLPDPCWRRVERWTRGVDVFEKEFCMLPIIKMLHWSLGILCNMPQLDARLRLEDSRLRLLLGEPWPPGLRQFEVTAEQLVALQKAQATVTAAAAAEANAAASILQRGGDVRGGFGRQRQRHASPPVAAAPPPPHELHESPPPPPVAMDSFGRLLPGYVQPDEERVISLSADSGSGVNAVATSGASNALSSDCLMSKLPVPSTFAESSSSSDTESESSIVTARALAPVPKIAAAPLTADADGAVVAAASSAESTSPEPPSAEASSVPAAYAPASARVPCIVLLDSLNCHKKAELGSFLRRYLLAEWIAHKNGGQPPGGRVGLVDMRSMLPEAPVKVPMQDNSCDCGVFIARYAQEWVNRWVDGAFGATGFTAADLKSGLARLEAPSWFGVADITAMRAAMHELAGDLLADSTLLRALSTPRGAMPGSAGNEPMDEPMGSVEARVLRPARLGVTRSGRSRFKVGSGGGAAASATAVSSTAFTDGNSTSGDSAAVSDHEPPPAKRRSVRAAAAAAGNAASDDDPEVQAAIKASLKSQAKAPSAPPTVAAAAILSQTSEPSPPDAGAAAMSTRESVAPVRVAARSVGSKRKDLMEIDADNDVIEDFQDHSKAPGVLAATAAAKPAASSGPTEIDSASKREQRRSSAGRAAFGNSVSGASTSAAGAAPVSSSKLSHSRRVPVASGSTSATSSVESVESADETVGLADYGCINLS